MLRAAYRFAHSESAGKLPGGWRLKRVARRLTAGRIFRVPYCGGHVWVRVDRASGHDVFTTGEYEPETVAVVRAFVNEGFHFVDVGANIGLITVAAALARKDASQQFRAFEPEPEAFAFLKRNLAANGLDFVVAENAGLGAAEGELTLNVSSTSNQGRHTFLPREKTTSGPKVPVRTLDGLFGPGAPSPLAGPTLFKIDVEGFEPQVLSGGRELLSSLPDAAVLCEVFPDLLKLQNLTPADVFKPLEDAGFGPPRPLRGSEEEAADFGNFLFLKGSGHGVAKGLSAFLSD